MIFKFNIVIAGRSVRESVISIKFLLHISIPISQVYFAQYTYTFLSLTVNHPVATHELGLSAGLHRQQSKLFLRPAASLNGMFSEVYIVVVFT